MELPEFRKESSTYKSPLESFIETTLQHYHGVEMVTIDVNFPKESYCFEIIYRAHIMNEDKYSEESWLVNENTLYVQPDKKILIETLREDEIYSIKYNLEFDKKLLFSFPVIFDNGDFA